MISLPVPYPLLHDVHIPMRSISHTDAILQGVHGHSQDLQQANQSYRSFFAKQLWSKCLAETKLKEIIYLKGH